MDTVRVFIGTEDNQYVTQQVFADTIRAVTSGPVEVRFCRQELERVGGTNFGFVRFMVPSMCQYSGRAIYCDADQVALADMRELWESLADGYAVALVNEPEGFFGDKKVERMNQTSVMVLDCAKLNSWEPDAMFANVVPNRVQLQGEQIHYRDFMTLSWFDQGLIQPLDPRWNHFNIIQPDTKLVHFSHVRSQPWKNPSHPLTERWAGFLKEAIRRGSLRRLKLLREIMRGHVHRRFLKYVFAP